MLRGAALHEASRRQSGQIIVYGIDERFWHFHSQNQGLALTGRQVLVSESLARELGTRAGDSLLLRIQKPSDIPVESLHGRKEDLGSTLRLTVRDMLPASALGEFSLQPQQSEVRAVFVPLSLLQKELGQAGKANTILVSESGERAPDEKESAARIGVLESLLNDQARLEDFGITLRALDQQRGMSLEDQSKVLTDQVADAARKAASSLSLSAMPVLSYLANAIEAGNRSIPYSLVTALDQESFDQLRTTRPKPGDKEDRGHIDTKVEFNKQPSGSPPNLPGNIPLAPPPIILNTWAASDLKVNPGDLISIEYYLWHENGGLETKTARFQLAAVVPIAGMAADRDLVPEYPGITEAQSLSGWDPPFPVDLGRVRKKDEDYWKQYRTTPKAFIPLVKGQELWKSRFGKLTSVRVNANDEKPLPSILAEYGHRLRANLKPAEMGLQIFPARMQGIKASHGATDFGEYFLYFSFFLIVSAILLTWLFFKLGVEQRLREIGTLEAIGFPPSTIGRLFLTEGIILSALGSLLGLVGALAYGYLLMLGLRTWWVGAVGTTMLTLHVNPLSMILGALGGVFASVVCIALTLRKLARVSTRCLLSGAESTAELKKEARKGARLSLITTSHLGFALSLLGVALLVAASLRQIGQVAGFFGGGTFLLVGLLCYQSTWLRKRKAKSIGGTGWWPVVRLGFRNTTHRPGRSILCIALIASASFIIVAVDAFRRDNRNLSSDRQSGNGGFPLLAESLLPLIHDPNTTEGREALNLTPTSNTPELKDVSFTRFRVRPGDDASCLNLYQPRSPKVIAPDEDFIRSNRFTFQNSLAATSEEKANPWLLLNSEFEDGSIPVIGDANSLTYVLHLKLGDEMVLNRSNGPMRIRVVGALADSIFQSELLMSEKNFLRLFPEEQGHRFFLLETARTNPADRLASTLEDRLSDYGFDVVPTSERLAEFHRVENTYLSTFQLLGGLGLVLGTLGMAAVLLRNVLERRRELALLRAVGYNSSHFAAMVIAENAFLLFCGLLTGTVCALLAVGPVVFGRGGRLPGGSLLPLLVLVMISGLGASLGATMAALRSPLIPALKAE
jgi:ABC-type lipoprotein release transport system permease subunit